MKAVILAGGLGTRLRPLTYTVPKPLIPLVGKPLIVRIIESLPNSVDTVILAVSYMREALEDYFRVHSCGRKLIIVNEPSPLGTGGAIKNVASYLDETFIALNGDCISSLDLRSMVKKHRECGGIGTIALWRVEDPSAYGVIQMDQNHRILDFQEKPRREEAKSNLINAGYYVLEPEILDYIGKGPVSIEREVFPMVLDYGLFGHHFTGYWTDCGTRENFLAAQAKLLELERPASSDSKGCYLAPSWVLSSNVKGAKIGPFACIDAGVMVGEGAEVSYSLVMKGAAIGAGCIIRDSIIGPGYKVNENEKVEGAILANR
ncbi:MAG: NDP-sugar synthase [Methanomassiliicoccales archaeon]